jgi:NAD(P)-dependent dehydrogenase (short-subunit alcohol dehydrogenase family)
MEQEVIEMFSSFDRGSVGFGPVQVVIVNHGYFPPVDVPTSRMSLEQWNSTINSNLTSSFLVLREFLKGLESATDVLKEKAAVVLIGSTSGAFGEAGHIDYSATKSGLFINSQINLC